MDGQKYENSGQLVILFSPKTGLFHCLANGLQHQLLRDEIGVGVGVASVGGEACQHLRRGLSADAPAVIADVFSLSEKIIEQCLDIKKNVFLRLKHWLMVATW